LDLGDQHCYFCVLDQDGKMISEGKVVTTPDALGKYFSTVAPSRIAMETGTHSGWVSRLAATYKHEVIVANARELRKIHQSDRKNDRADARILARMARFDPELLSPIQRILRALATQHWRKSLRFLGLYSRESAVSAAFEV
jgi:transposase